MLKIMATIAAIGSLAIAGPSNAAPAHIDPFQFANEFSEVLAAGTTRNLTFDQTEIDAFFRCASG